MKDSLSNIEKAIRDYGMDRKKEHQEKMEVLHESKGLLEKRNLLLERLINHFEKLDYQWFMVVCTMLHNG